MLIETIIDIDKPPSEVYEFLMDEENLRLWIKNFVKLERLEGGDGTVGASSKHIYDDNGKRVEFIEEILVAESGKRFHSVLRNSKMEILLKNEFQVISDNATRLLVSSEYKPQQLITIIQLFFSKKKLLKRQQKDMSRFKAALENLSVLD